MGNWVEMRLYGRNIEYVRHKNMVATVKEFRYFLLYLLIIVRYGIIFYNSGSE